MDWESRLWAKVTIGDDPDGCWIFEGAKVNGYGVLRIAGKNQYVHCLAYELLVNLVPDGYQVHHRCHDLRSCPFTAADCPHRACVNPEHLEAVTRDEHMAIGGNATKTHCPRGHPYDEENTYRARGKRHCRACKLEYQRARYTPRPRKLPSTHCPKGHEYTVENTYWSNNKRSCKICTIERMRKNRT